MTTTTTATETTRERLLDAAEQAFAEQGFEAVSLREIMRRADVNPAAIHYHFGSKEALLRGVLDRVIQPLNARRFELLDEARAAAGAAPLSVEVILRAFVLPDLEVIEALRGRAHLARFVGRCYAQPTPFIERLMEEQFGPVRERFFPELERALPDLPPDELEWRMYLVAGALVGLFASLRPDGAESEGAAAGGTPLLDRLIAFMAAGLRAPVHRAVDAREQAVE